MNSKPLLIAHRGNTSDFPENTTEAFASAFEKGADGIELDVHLNSRSQVIVVHHYTHDPNGNYPLLSEVLESFSDKGRLEIEIKSLDSECVLQIKKLIDHFQPPDYALTSSIQPLLPIIRQQFPKALIGLIFRRWLIEDWMPADFVPTWIIGHLKLTGANVIHLDLDQYSEELVHALKKAGYLTHSHLKTGSQKDWGAVIQLGIDQCTFDDIELLKYNHST